MGAKIQISQKKTTKWNSMRLLHTANRHKAPKSVMRPFRDLQMVKVVDPPPKGPPRYMLAPEYGESTDFAGATSMRVVIGPAQALKTNHGHKPQPNTPQVMRLLLDDPELLHHGWIAGHLLNDNLGGPGLAKNLTPLTTAGNKNHLNVCEAKIKNFIDSAFSRTQYYKADEYWYGVEYNVSKAGVAWKKEHPALQFVATALQVWARVVKQHKDTLEISPASAQEAPFATYFAPIDGVLVDNEGHGLLDPEPAD